LYKSSKYPVTSFIEVRLALLKIKYFGYLGLSILGGDYDLSTVHRHEEK